MWRRGVRYIAEQYCWRFECRIVTDDWSSRECYYWDPHSLLFGAIPPVYDQLCIGRRGLAIYLSITRSIPEKILFLSEEVEMKRVTLFAEEEEGSIVGSGGSMGELIQTAGARVWLYWRSAKHINEYTACTSKHRPTGTELNSSTNHGYITTSSTSTRTTT